MELPTCDGDNFFCLDFGFCPKLNDHKVVKVIGSPGSWPPLKVEGNNLSTYSWKKVTIANPGQVHHQWSFLLARTRKFTKYNVDHVIYFDEKISIDKSAKSS